MQPFGITSSLNIEGTSTICWSIYDNGDNIKLHIRDSIFIPATPMCSLSPLTVVQQQTKTSFMVFMLKSKLGYLLLLGISKHFLTTVHGMSINHVDSCNVLLTRYNKKSFWPCAIQLAVDLHNSTPNSDGITPTEIFLVVVKHRIIFVIFTLSVVPFWF
jgi:hypothetical protein